MLPKLRLVKINAASRSRCCKPIASAGLSIQKSAFRSSESACYIAISKLLRRAPAISAACKDSMANFHDSSAINRQEMKRQAMCTAAQRRHELLKKLGHDNSNILRGDRHIPTSPVLPAPSVQDLQESMVSTTTFEDHDKNNIVDDDLSANAPRGKLQKNAAASMTADQPPAVGESKLGCGPQIIRKSMFKFVIKLGSAGPSNAGHQISAFH
jgi:hypothetical protein